MRAAVGAAALGVLVVGASLAAPDRARGADPARDEPAGAIATPMAEPSPAAGRVVYRASRVASFESLGVTMIACRHRDPGPRMLAVEFFDAQGKPVTLFGPSLVPRWLPGKKLLFVSDPTYFRNRDIIDMRVAHLASGTARIISDARILHCRAKMRFDAGAGRPSYVRGVGLYRAGVGATPVPVEW